VLLREAGAIREELANDPAGRVVVGMPAGLRHIVTLPALQVMRSSSPSTVVRVHEGFNVLLCDMMKHGLLDIAVIAVEQVSEVSVVPEMLVREPLVLVRCAKLPPPRAPAEIEDVVEYPLALPGRPNVVRGIVDRAIRERRLTAKIPLEPENPELCLDFVRCELVGQTVTLRSVLAEKDTSGMHVVPFAERELYWTFLVHRQRHQIAPVRRFASIIQSTIVEAVHNGPWVGASIVG
jgi:DNA-binding transcriptional LysR family regulator